MKRRESAASLFGVIVAVIWGMTFLSIKVALRELGPMSLSLFRFVIASVLLAGIMAASRTSFAIAWRDVPLLALSSFVGVTLYFFFENNGILRLTASESSLIIGVIPVVTLIGEILFLRTRPGRLIALGIVLSFVGVALIVLRSESASASPLGYLYMVGAALSWVVYGFATKPLSGRYPMLAITFWQMVIVAIACIPFAVAERQVWAGLSATALFNAAYLGIFGSAIGYWLYVIVLEHLGPGRSSVFINLIPVVSVAASFVILGERLSALQIAGGIIAISGVYMATVSSQAKRHQ
jgi:drug/metabolite transporter (DMT)-like permease